MKILLLLLSFALYAVDYDCIFVGSSPIPLFEALYQYESGKKVLILEAADDCGGAWRSIDICGVQHADLGCHQIGNDQNLADFLRVYAGCSIVSLDQPNSAFTTRCSNGFYFSKGCYELIHNLKRRIAATSIELLVNHTVEWAQVDHDWVVIKAQGKQFSAKKLFFSPYCYFTNGKISRQVQKTKYYHLYVLISDPTPPRFCYSFGIPETSRMINLTHFVGLAESGRQLIAFQLYKDPTLHDGEKFLTELKKKNLVDSSAYILTAEPYIYEQWPSNPPNLFPGQQQFFENLTTHSFQSMSSYIEKWKQVLKPYKEVILP